MSILTSPKGELFFKTYLESLGNQMLTLPSITSWFNMQLLTKRRWM